MVINDAGNSQEELAQNRYDELRSRRNEIERDIDRNDNNPRYDIVSAQKELTDIFNKMGELKRQFGYAIKDSTNTFIKRNCEIKDKDVKTVYKDTKSNLYIEYDYDSKLYYVASDEDIDTNMFKSVEEAKRYLEINRDSLLRTLNDSAKRDDSNLEESFEGHYDPATVNTGLSVEMNPRDDGNRFDPLKSGCDLLNSFVSLGTGDDDNLVNSANSVATFEEGETNMGNVEEEELKTRKTDAKITVDRLIQIITPIVSDYAKKKGVEDYWKIHKSGKNVSVGMELGYRDMDKLCDILNAKLAPITDSYFEPADAGLIETTVFDSAVELGDGYLGLSSSQEYELKRYAERFGYDMIDVYDGLNSRVSREGMSLQKAIEDIKETMVATRSLYDSATKDESDLQLIKDYFNEDQPNKKIELRHKLKSMGYEEGVNGVAGRDIMWVKLNGKKYEVKNLKNVTQLNSAIKDDAVTKAVNLGRYNIYDTFIMKKANDYGLKLRGEGNVVEVMGSPTNIKLFIDLLNEYHSAGARIIDSDTVNDIGSYSIGDKYRWERRYGNAPITLQEINSDGIIKLSLDNSKMFVQMDREKFEGMLRGGEIKSTETNTIEEYNGVGVSK